jgi:hypothetical protein
MSWMMQKWLGSSVLTGHTFSATVMQPVLHWASNLLILGFSAASGTSAKHFCSCFHALASHSRASASLSHMFQQFSLTSASAIHKISNCLSLAPGRTSKNHSKASRAMQQQATCGLAKRWMQIGQGKVNASLPEVSTHLQLCVYKACQHSQFVLRFAKHCPTWTMNVDAT